MRRSPLLIAAVAVAALAACGGDDAAPPSAPAATSASIGVDASPGSRPATPGSVTTRPDAGPTTTGGGGQAPVVNPVVQQLIGDNDLAEIGLAEVRPCAVQVADTAIGQGQVSATDRNQVGYLLGGAIVGCAGPDKVARGLAASARRDMGEKYRAQQLDCIEGRFVAMTDVELGTLLGAFMLRDEDQARALFRPINDACGTDL